jgi:hypothetical protein
VLSKLAKRPSSGLAFSPAHNGRTADAPSNAVWRPCGARLKIRLVRVQRFIDSFPVRSKVEQLLRDKPAIVPSENVTIKPLLLSISTSSMRGLFAHAGQDMVSAQHSPTPLVADVKI